MWKILTRGRLNKQSLREELEKPGLELKRIMFPSKISRNEKYAKTN